MDKLFTKHYHAPIKEGLASTLGMELYGTLCVLATFIDSDGMCYPTQDHIARLTGVTRNTANKRLNKLCEFTWQGEQILTKQQTRSGGTFSNTVYRLNEKLFGIF